MHQGLAKLHKAILVQSALMHAPIRGSWNKPREPDECPYCAQGQAQDLANPSNLQSKLKSGVWQPFRSIRRWARRTAAAVFPTTINHNIGAIQEMVASGILERCDHIGISAR